MACSPTPTETQYATVVSSLSSVTFSSSLSPLPAVVATLTSFSCSLTVRPGNETGCVNVGVPFATTIDGGEITVQVPVFTFLPVTQVVPTATLFEPCSSQSPVDLPLPSAFTPHSDASSVQSNLSPLSTPSSSSSRPSLSSTPTNDPPSASASPSSSSLAVSSPRAGGTGSSVTTTTTTSSLTQLPSPPGMSSSPPSGTTTQQDNTSTSTAKSLVGPIVGGILGGFFGLIGIVCFIWFLWHRRGRLFAISNRAPSPPPDVPEMGYSRSRTRDSQVPCSGDPEPKPYQYGTVGSVRSHERDSSLPGSSRQSSFYSQGHSPTSRRSYAGSASLRLSMGGLPTPPIMPSTALSPGSSQPSSRPSTPGYFGHSPPPSAFNHSVRQSWPQVGGASDDGQDGSGSESHGSGSHALVGASPSPRRSRRPSRLSLTFSNCEAAANDEDGVRSRAVSSRSVSMSASLSMSGDTTRPASAGADDRTERPKSVLFVVNGEAPPPILSDSGVPT